MTENTKCKEMYGPLKWYNYKTLPKHLPKFPVQILYRDRIRIWDGKRLI